MMGAAFMAVSISAPLAHETESGACAITGCRSFVTDLANARFARCIIAAIPLLRPGARTMIKAIQFGLKNYFYFSMSLLICLIVAVGFGPHLGQKLLRPTIPVPTILYWHALVFTGWVALFFTQTVL